MAFILFLAGVGFIVFGFMWTEGMWSNAITWVNTIFASLIAWTFWEPLAKLLDDAVPQGTYVWDFLVLWILFAIVMIILRVVTKTMSARRVKFKKSVETAGNAAFALLTAFWIVCFTTATLHTAPLAPDAFGGKFPPGETGSLFGIAPDRIWLWTAHNASAGSLQPLSGAPTDWYSMGQNPSDGFVSKYKQRRTTLSETEGFFPD